MGAIDDEIRRYWYGSPGIKDRRKSKRMSAELFRYQQIEKALEELLKHPDSDDARKQARKALKPVNYDAIA